MNDFVFKFIFEKEKNKAWTNSSWFRFYLKNNYGITNQDDGTRLYIAINKYQVKKFGRTIDPKFLYYKEDYINKARAIRSLRTKRKK